MPSTAPSSADGARELPRFARTVRIVHRVFGALMIVCILTAAVLYNSSLSIAFGHRRVFELVHVYCGLALPIPLLVGLASRAYRDDLGRLNRFRPADWQWLRSSTRRNGKIRVGKFNAGQKINASLTGGAALVLFMTGVLMYFTGLAGLSWRSGATFIHDWFALGLGLLVVGHLTFAFKDPEARRGMRRGTVRTDWARREHADWAAEMASTAGAPAPEPGSGDLTT